MKENHHNFEYVDALIIAEVAMQPELPGWVTGKPLRMVIWKLS